MKHARSLLTGALLLISFVAPTVLLANPVSGFYLDSNEFVFESDDPSITDTRRVVSHKSVVNIFPSGEKGQIIGVGAAAGIVTHNPDNPSDLWVVTCSHCIKDIADKTTIERYIKINVPDTGECFEMTSEDVIYAGDYLRDDIAIIDIPDDALAIPIPMDPSYQGSVQVLGTTEAFHNGLGTKMRVATISGPCSFWQEPKRPENVVATDCPGSEGSSGSGLVGTRDGELVVVGVLSYLEKTFIEREDFEGQQSRRLFRRASLETF